MTQACYFVRDKCNYTCFGKNCKSEFPAEEICPARTKPSSIVRHDSILLTIGAIHHTLPHYWCDSSHPTCSFSHEIRNRLKIRRFAIVPALAQPITLVNSLLDPTKKTRMFPLMRTFYMSVFYRIVVYVIHMLSKILLIGNQMFPEPPLPNASLSSFDSRFRNRHIPAAGGEPRFREPPFYHAPSYREIVVIVRHLPYTMTMFRQEHNTRHFERT